MTSVHQKFLLCSLEIPNATTLCTSNDAELRQLVAWLEQKLIRQYRPEDRVPVSDTTSERWLQAYQQYLDDLNCPVKHTGAALKSPAVMDWLLHYAVDLMHGDKAKVLSPLSISSSTLEEVDKQIAIHVTFSDVGQPEVKAALKSFLKQLGLESSDDNLAQTLAAAKQILADNIMPAFRDIELRKSKGSDSPAFLDLNSYPLGFSMGDEKTDLAAKLLRMLYIKDLRALQTQIDDMVVQIQEFTANPRIIASLGVVGR